MDLTAAKNLYGQIYTDSQSNGYKCDCPRSQIRLIGVDSTVYSNSPQALDGLAQMMGGLAMNKTFTKDTQDNLNILGWLVLYEI